MEKVVSREKEDIKKEMAKELMQLLVNTIGKEELLQALFNCFEKEELLSIMMKQNLEIKPEKVIQKAETGIEDIIEEKTRKVLKKLGGPKHLKGYDYTIKAMKLWIKEKGYCGMITKGLYPDLAKEFVTTPSRVERAIRHFIEVIWARGDLNYINNIFGYSVDKTKRKPTNSEFISCLADEISFEMKKKK